MKAIHFTKFILPLLCSLFFSQAKAQNMNYALQKDSSEYVSLSTPTTLSANENWRDKHFKIPLPFSFNFCGYQSDTAYIETNGFILFNKENQLALVSFNEFSSKKDSTNSYIASLGYTNEGSNGNRIIKIELKNLAKSNYSFYDNLSYQVWLYENGNKIEFHMGDHAFSSIPEETLVLLGIINRNMNSNPAANLVNGSVYTSSLQTITNENELIYLTGHLSEGIVFTLTPSF